MRFLRSKALFPVFNLVLIILLIVINVRQFQLIDVHSETEIRRGAFLSEVLMGVLCVSSGIQLCKTYKLGGRISIVIGVIILLMAVEYAYKAIGLR